MSLPSFIFDTLRSAMLKAPCLCVLILCASWACAQQPQNPSLDHARQLFAQGKLDQSLAELDLLDKQSPEPAGVERLRGFIFYQQNNFIEADAAFARALQQDHSDLEAMQLRGVTLFRMGKAAEAIPLLEQARAVCSERKHRSQLRPRRRLHAGGTQRRCPPRFRRTVRLCARLRAGLPARRPHVFSPGKRARGPCVHDESAGLEREPPACASASREIALAAGDTTGAIAEFEKEVQVNPLNGEVYDRLGDAYLRNRQFSDAQHALNRAVLLEPNATGPYILLGKLMLSQQNPVMASMYLERARQMDPGNYMTHFLLGQAYRTQGRKDDAAREFHTAGQLQSANPPKADEPR